jgi:hypothetical protein
VHPQVQLTLKPSIAGISAAVRLRASAPRTPRITPTGFRLARSSAERDEPHATLADLATRIHRLRGGQGIDTVAVQISRPEVVDGFIPSVMGSGTPVQRAAVAVHILGPDGERRSLLGYAFAADREAPILTAAQLRDALLRITPEPLRMVTADLESEAA